MENHKDSNKRDLDNDEPSAGANSTMPIDLDSIDELDGDTQRVVFEQDDRFDFSDDDDFGEHGDVDDMFK